MSSYTALERRIRRKARSQGVMIRRYPADRYTDLDEDAYVVRTPFGDSCFLTPPEVKVVEDDGRYWTLDQLAERFDSPGPVPPTPADKRLPPGWR